MRRIAVMVFINTVSVMLIAGSVLGARRANVCYGPRALYSPFQARVSDSESFDSATEAFELAWQDTVEEPKPIMEQIKKPGRAFFQSLLIPGWGQYYSESKIRGLIMFGVEVTAVSYGLLNHKSGNDWEKDYKAFADDHWIEGEYISWFEYWDWWFQANQPIVNERPIDSLGSILSHSLPESKDHDYYEMIGKYDQFVYGWDDVHGDPLNLEPSDTTLIPIQEAQVWKDTGYVAQTFDPYLGDVESARRNEYLDMRDKSNKAFKRAKTMVGIILFNHVISAIDAARCARNYNVKHAEVKTSLRMRLKKYEREHIPQLVLTHRFY